MNLHKLLIVLLWTSGAFAENVLVVVDGNSPVDTKKVKSLFQHFKNTDKVTAVVIYNDLDRSKKYIDSLSINSKNFSEEKDRFLFRINNLDLNIRKKFGEKVLMCEKQVKIKQNKLVGKTGIIRFNFAWDANIDIDPVILDPNNDAMGYNCTWPVNKDKNDNCKNTFSLGTWDVDDQGDGSGLVDKPNQENFYWPNDAKPIDGKYKVFIRNFSNQWPNNKPVEVVLTIKRGESIKKVTYKIPVNKKDNGPYSFDFKYKGVDLSEDPSNFKIVLEKKSVVLPLDEHHIFDNLSKVNLDTYSKVYLFSDMTHNVNGFNYQEEEQKVGKSKANKLVLDKYGIDLNKIIINNK